MTVVMEHCLVTGMFMVDFVNALMTIAVTFVYSITVILITAAAALFLMVFQVRAKVIVRVQVLALTNAITLL